MRQPPIGTQPNPKVRWSPTRLWCQQKLWCHESRAAPALHHRGVARADHSRPAAMTPSERRASGGLFRDEICHVVRFVGEICHVVFRDEVTWCLTSLTRESRPLYRDDADHGPHRSWSRRIRWRRSRGHCMGMKIRWVTNPSSDSVEIQVALTKRAPVPQMLLGL